MGEWIDTCVLTPVTPRELSCSQTNFGINFIMQARSWRVFSKGSAHLRSLLAVSKFVQQRFIYKNFPAEFFKSLHAPLATHTRRLDALTKFEISFHLFKKRSFALKQPLEKQWDVEQLFRNFEIWRLVRDVWSEFHKIFLNKDATWINLVKIRGKLFSELDCKAKIRT